MIPIWLALLIAWVAFGIGYAVARTRYENRGSGK